MTVSATLPSMVDIAYAAFAIWTIPALVRVLTGRKVKFNDPLRVLGLLLNSSRYAFVVVRWIYGAHRELISQAKIVGRDAAEVWAAAVMLIAVVVIRGYKALGGGRWRGPGGRRRHRRWQTPGDPHRGWNYGSIGVWLFGLIGTPTVVVALLKLVAVMRKLANEREAADDSSMLAGFKAVIDAQAAEIGRLTERIDKLELEARLERERRITDTRHRHARHEAELSLQRHATRNAKQIVYGFLDLIEVKPEDAAAIASRMRKRMEERDRQAIEEGGTHPGCEHHRGQSSGAERLASP